MPEPPPEPPTGSPAAEGLNPIQHDAVIHSGGPLLVVAGAGSGKTRVLTHRIAHLISEGMSPFEILAITFTNKAATEMKTRVGALIGPVAEKMWVSTFHSACVRMLRRDAERLGFAPGFSIYDQADSRRLAGYVIRDLDLDVKRFQPRSVLAAISAAKNANVGPERFAETVAHSRQRHVASVYAEYQRRLLASGAMDFDDLLVHTCTLLREHPEALAHWRGRFAHVLVDEYQDTNTVQNDLVVTLAAEHRQVTVVGDSDQSVYAFRGADVRNIDEFEKAFPDASTLILDQNYRSTQTILDAANDVIAANPGRKPKDLWTDRGSGRAIVHCHADDAEDEAQWVARSLAELHHGEDFDWSDMAVFYRVHSQSRALEEALVRVGIPYRVVAGTRFYDRREIKDAIAYVRAVFNPTDEVSVKRVINTPRRGLGQVSMGRLDDWAARNGVGFDQALAHHAQAGLSAKASAGVKAFLAMAEAIRDRCSEPAAVIEETLTQSGYLHELEDERTLEAETRLENIHELIDMAYEHDTVEEFLERVSLVNETDDLADPDTDPSAVSLMTLHAAKGLEFGAVFITGMEDGVLPHMRALTEPAELEEERRLAYVGMTRAMRRLHLSSAWSRMMNGMTQYNPPSRFIDDIRPELIERVVGRRMGRARARSGGAGYPRSVPGAGRLFGGAGQAPLSAGLGSGRKGDGAARASWRSGRGDRLSLGTDLTAPGSERPGGGSDGDVRGAGRDASRIGSNRERMVDDALRAGSQSPGRQTAGSLGAGGHSAGGHSVGALRDASRGLSSGSGAQPRASAAQAVAIGDNVSHHTFGEGVVLDMSGSGDDTEAVVRFRDVGEKRLLLAWANLERIE